MRKSVEEPYFTTVQVAERFGVSREKIVAWIESGELAAINVASRGSIRPRWKISPAALAAFERSRAATPKPPAKKRARRPANVIEYF